MMIRICQILAPTMKYPSSDLHSTGTYCTRARTGKAPGHGHLDDDDFDIEVVRRWSTRSDFASYYYGT